MNNTLYEQSLLTLEYLENMHQKTNARLEYLGKYSDVLLKSANINGHNYYYSNKKRCPDSVRKYIGGESSAKVKEIKEYRYLSQLSKDIECEIKLIKDLRKKHLDLSNEAVNGRIPKVYRMNQSTSLSNSEQAKQWKEDKEAEKAQYDIKKPEHLIMKAIDGTRMRSKSEVIIANMLIANGIPYVYELPHRINGVLIYTDFTVLSLKDCITEVLIEHEGLMMNIGYQETLLFKINHYLADDLIPGRDIFFTFDDLHGGFDPSPIQDIIKTKLINDNEISD